MAISVALLRAVNVGGTGKLPMTPLSHMCKEATAQAIVVAFFLDDPLARDALKDSAGQGPDEQTAAGA